VDERVTFNADNKFDIQLDAALVKERRLAELLCCGTFERIEHKGETYQWRRTGCIFVEVRRAGKLSGIAVTQADIWVHELFDDDGALLGGLNLPVRVLKPMAREAWKDPKRRKTMAGDGGLSEGVVLRLTDLLKLVE
jgi:hypothetical protein